LEASTKYIKKPWEAPAQTLIEWKMDRSGGSCGSGISEPIGLVYLASMGGTGTILDSGEDGCWKPQK
jgi:hypothetical protein